MLSDNGAAAKYRSQEFANGERILGGVLGLTQVGAEGDELIVFKSTLNVNPSKYT